MRINKEHWLHSLDIISNSVLLKEEFETRSKLSFNHGLLKTTFNADLLKDSVISIVENVGAICFEIDGKIFLQGETKGDYDLVGDNCGNQPLTELFDITTEMKNGQSYSFYVSTTSFFKLASIHDTVKVNEFLKTLK